MPVIATAPAALGTPYWDLLAADTVEDILGRLDPRSLCRMGCTSRAVRHQTQFDDLWHPHFAALRQGPGAAERARALALKSGTRAPIPPPPTDCSWRTLFVAIGRLRGSTAAIVAPPEFVYNLLERPANFHMRWRLIDMELNQYHLQGAAGQEREGRAVAVARLQQAMRFGEPTRLDLSELRLTALPNIIGLARRDLDNLILDKNCLRSLPPSLGDLSQLSQLSLSHNHLTEVGPIWQLPQLERLYLDYNHLQSLGELPGKRPIRMINLQKNPYLGALPDAGLLPCLNLMELTLTETAIAADNPTAAAITRRGGVVMTPAGERIQPDPRALPMWPSCY